MNTHRERRVGKKLVMQKGLTFFCRGYVFRRGCPLQSHSFITTCRHFLQGGTAVAHRLDRTCCNLEWTTVFYSVVLIQYNSLSFSLYMIKTSQPCCLFFPVVHHGIASNKIFCIPENKIFFCVYNILSKVGW